MRRDTDVMSSRERIRAVVNRQPKDHLPLCFDAICHGIIGFLVRRQMDKTCVAEFLMDLGVDTGIAITPPLISERGITIHEWRDQPAGERYPVLHKEYVTPKGTLRQVVRKTDDYPERIELISDRNVPASRSITHLVEKEEHLDALECLLASLDDEALAPFRADATRYRAFCDKHQILLSGYLSGVGDPLIWLSGVETCLLSAIDDPGFMQRYVDIIAWDRRR